MATERKRGREGGWRALAAAAAIGAAAGDAAAQETRTEVLVGAGYNAVFGGDEGVAGLLELRSGALLALGRLALRLGGGVEAATQGDLWVGAGLVASVDLTGRLRFDLSVMPGAYHAGGGNDLGSGFEVRSWAGLSYAVDDVWRVGAALNHKSNAGLGEINPGVETALVYLSRSF